MSSFAKYQVLSIDDSKAVHAFLDRCLSEGGQEFTFTHALGVKDGISLIEQNPAAICAVLLDWEMPEITGYEGLPMILAKYPGIPVIMLTTKNDPEDIASMLDRGARDYMMKPFTPDIIFEKLRSVIEAQ